MPITSRFLHTAEFLLRPGADDTAVRRNFLLPQFQSALGTVVHATPVAEALRQAVPDARIVVASSGLAQQVWQGNPFIDEVVHVPNPLGAFGSAVRAMRHIRAFGQAGYTTLLTTGNERTKITVACVMSGYSRRIGFAVRRELLHAPVEYDPGLSQIANNLRLLPAAGVQAVRSHYEPSIGTSSDDDAAEQLPGPRTGVRIALATQTSVTQRKGWRAERWVELVRKLRERTGAEFVLIGTAAEQPAIEALQSGFGFSTVSIAGQTTIPQLAAVLRQCDVAVMLDTGPLHVARAAGLPVAIIAPAWSPPHEWLPVGHPRYRILKNDDFPPPAPADYIIDEVSVDEVLDAVLELLRLRRAPVLH